MTFKLTRSHMMVALALALLMALLAACDSAPTPQVSTPAISEPTPPAIAHTPPAPTPALETATSEAPPAPSPTVENSSASPDVPPTSLPSPSPTETPQPEPTATNTQVATSTHQITATTAPPKPTATPEATETPAPLTYFFPVEPPGVTSYGATHHDYPATDIFCPIGSRFVAPIDGVVDYVSYEDPWKPSVDDPATRGGLSIAIIGVDGVRYYGSHLSKIEAEIKPGVKVKGGQLLGRTGKSGNARDTPAHLHFGISHPTTPDDWEVRRGEIGPYKYLKAWQAGKSLKPDLTP